jgi:tetratricopeptide (TPR) repeat protein
LKTDHHLRLLAVLLALLLSFVVKLMPAQETSQPAVVEVDGIIRDSAGKPITGVSVLLSKEEGSSPTETKTDGAGAFSFSAVAAGTYKVTAKKSGFRDAIEDSIKLSPAEKKHCEFVLQASGGSSSSLASGIELDDRPHFTVAGITDSTGSGGHGSETRMRTGETLAKETLNLESSKSEETPTAAPKDGAGAETRESENALHAALLKNPQSFATNHALGAFYFHSQRCREAIPLLEAAYKLEPRDHANDIDLVLALRACGENSKARDDASQMLATAKSLGKREEADLRHALGDLDEKLGDPLGAAREYERAAGLDSSEQNYFAWGAELLLHRAAAPAAEVFGRGIRLHPDSARMLAGLGAALYTSGSADEAAQRLCEAADLGPANPAPYLFLGKVQEAASGPLPCAEQELARFAQDQPENAFAKYYYALALWKRNRGSENSDALRHAEALLEKASTIDPKLDAAYVQLGNLHFARGAFPEAVAAYQKAIATNPSSSEAHYRLGLAFKRIGEEAKAQSEFEQYKQLDKTETAAIERQRRELRQFLFVLQDQPKDSQPNPDPVPPSVPR